MGRFFEALKRGVSAAAQGPEGEQFSVGGHTVACPLCGHDRFIPGKALLNSAGMTFMGLDWTEHSASTLACKECGRIEWFLQEPERIDDHPAS